MPLPLSVFFTIQSFTYDCLPSLFSENSFYISKTKIFVRKIQHSFDNSMFFMLITCGL